MKIEEKWNEKLESRVNVERGSRGESKQQKKKKKVEVCKGNLKQINYDRSHLVGQFLL